MNLTLSINNESLLNSVKTFKQDTNVRILICQFMMQRKIRDYYQLEEDQCIGEGSFAKVVRARQIKTGKVVAVKIIKKQKMNEQEEVLLDREIHIMKNINHPNIVEFYDNFEDSKQIYLVLEYLSGGELYQEICAKQVYTEEEARKVISPIIDAIRYLHQCGIVHRDLKPENCVFSSRNQDRAIKLIDFGVSQIIPNDTHLLSSAVGTPLYMAPEILSRMKYDVQVDWWSIGVMLYVLLCGYPPFESENQDDLKNEILTIGVKFDPDDWSKVSADAQNLVKKLLTVDHTLRIRANDIIDHPWIVNEAKGQHLHSVQDGLKLMKLHQARHTYRALRILQKIK